MGCSGVICCELFAGLINNTEALPEWKPGLSNCLFLSFGHDQLLAGALHAPAACSLARCRQQKRSGWQSCGEPASRAGMLINISQSQLPGCWGARGGLAGQALCSGGAPGCREGGVWVWWRVLPKEGQLSKSM